MHYCTSGIFFYETWPINLNLMRKAFMQMCTIVIVWKHLCVEEGILDSDWYFVFIYSSHGTIICVCIHFRYMNCCLNRSCYYRLYICVCFSQHSLCIPLLVVYHMLPFQTYICIDDINSECSNLYLSLHCDYSCEAIFEWLNIFYLFYRVIYMPDK